MKDDRIYVGHMFDHASQALDILQGKNRDDYDADPILRLALTHLVQIIGEAARRVQPPFRESHPEIPWKQIVGMRHKVVHDYISIDFGILWIVVSQDLPALVPKLEAILATPVDPSPSA
jgi:uncharacterized protein with HEPN domain